MRRNLLATLLVPQGTPMILMGDEIGHTLAGNNNAYCQDNELAWLDWEHRSERDWAFLAFIKRLIGLRASMPVLRQTNFLHGAPVDESGVPDVVWIKPDGKNMGPEDWKNRHTKSIGLLLCDATLARTLTLLNAHHESVRFHLPAVNATRTWRLAIETASGRIEPDERDYAPGEEFDLPGRSLFLFTMHPR
jgi:glycogen operon protein